MLSAVTLSTVCPGRGHLLLVCTAVWLAGVSSGHCPALTMIAPMRVCAHTHTNMYTQTQPSPTYLCNHICKACERCLTTSDAQTDVLSFCPCYVHPLETQVGTLILSTLCISQTVGEEGVLCLTRSDKRCHTSS